MIKKSIFAALLIAFGMFVLMVAPSPIGTFLFAFGLMGICYCDGYLYTGKCGYVFDNKQYQTLLGILAINIAAGWLFGFIMSYLNPTIQTLAQLRIDGWIQPLVHLIQSIFCGSIMFLAVDIKKRTGSVLGIIYGIPLFIFCSFQHSIANAIACGMAHTIHPFLLIAIIGNFIGSIFIWYLTKE